MAHSVWPKRSQSYESSNKQNVTTITSPKPARARGDYLTINPLTGEATTVNSKTGDYSPTPTVSNHPVR